MLYINMYSRTPLHKIHGAKLFSLCYHNFVLSYMLSIQNQYIEHESQFVLSGSFVLTVCVKGVHLTQNHVGQIVQFVLSRVCVIRLLT